MKRTFAAWTCLAAGLLSLAAFANSERLMDLSMRTRAARLAGDNKGWLEHGQRVLQLAPDHPDLLISVARAMAANGRFDDALTKLEDAIRRGAGFDLAAFAELKSAPDSPRLRAVREAALQNMTAIAAPEVFLALENKSLEPEGITWDPVGRQLYFGSLNGEIWRLDLTRKLERFAGPDTGLREVLGLKVDAERRLLWAVTGVFPDVVPVPGRPKENVGTTGLYAYDLDTGKRVRACELDERPTVHAFNDMALARNGDVYASDSPDSAIYKLSANSCKLERMMQDPAVTFPNGIALAPDESMLYVAHVEGISAVDLRSGKRTLLSVPKNAAVNSIDGLVWDGKDLLALQPSPYLSRVARINLADDGLAVREVVTMSSRPPLGLNPTTGVVAGDHYYMVAGFPDGLATAAGQPPRRSHVLRSRMR
jgi:sugar lactone lactonase YvrE